LWCGVVIGQKRDRFAGHGALARADAALKPSVRHFLAHLHRAAHQLTRARS
jgi:hypothetical protein